MISHLWTWPIQPAFKYFWKKTSITNLRTLSWKLPNLFRICSQCRLATNALHNAFRENHGTPCSFFSDCQLTSPHGAHNSLYYLGRRNKAIVNRRTLDYFTTYIIILENQSVMKKKGAALYFNSSTSLKSWNHAVYATHLGTACSDVKW